MLVVDRKWHVRYNPEWWPLIKPEERQEKQKEWDLVSDWVLREHWNDYLIAVDFYYAGGTIQAPLDPPESTR